MKKKISIFVCLIQILCYTSYAKGLTTSYYNDFSAMTDISGEAELSYVPDDDGNKALYFYEGDYKTADITHEIKLDTPVNIEGKLLREYNGSDDPYWDLRIFLTTDSNAYLLSSFGKNVYLGSKWENISVYDRTSLLWSDFRIRLTNVEDGINAELFLDGNSYGSVKEKILGNIKGVRLGVFSENGSVYADDLKYVSESAELNAFLNKIDEDTADKESCLEC